MLKPAAEIRIGDVVRTTETDFRMVECFDMAHNACTLTSNCKLRQVFSVVLDSFLAELDKVTLADIAGGKTPGRPQVATLARGTARSPLIARSS